MSIEAIATLLAKQKLVESMIHNQNQNQNTPRQEVVETLVYRQHLVELETLLAKLSVKEIGDILEALPLPDAQLLWVRIPKERESDLLWEVSSELRDGLIKVREPTPNESQINAFELIDGRLCQITVTARNHLDGIKPIWIDLINATPTERLYISRHFDLELPDLGAATDLEVSSRFHIEENNAIYLHSNFLLDKEGKNSRCVPVAFVIHQGILFSLREEELPVFRLQRRRARNRIGYVADCTDLLLDLYGADVEYSADSLEDIYRTLSEVSRQVLSETMTDEEAAAVLASIAEEENLNGQVRSNILDTQRALTFLMQSRLLSNDKLSDIKQILHNIDSLNSHTAFLFDKINFLMDATIGFININQNKRVNQLTVWGVVFMPINILAGIGGMSEFSMMTQGIPWPLAYGAFALSMALIGGLTYRALRHAESQRAKKAALAAAGRS